MKNNFKEKLDELYLSYNKRSYVDPDPLLFLYDYPDVRDREIAGLIAACLAYGRVEFIMKSVASVLEKLSPSPAAYILSRSEKDMAQDFKGFRYRYAGEAHMLSLLLGIRNVLNVFSSLEACVADGLSDKDKTLMPGLESLFRHLVKAGNPGHLLADPSKKSACKRSQLFLRWMVRKDEVDPGGWDSICASKLIVPLDTHMHKVGKILGFTLRKSADMKTALEITEGFRQVEKNDPVKYDFCLTRFGIRRDMEMEELRLMMVDNHNS